MNSKANWLLLLLSVVLLAACQLPSTVGSQKVVQQIRGPDGNWDYASFDAAQHRILIGRSYGVMALDVATGQVTRLAEGSGVHAGFMLPNGRLLITNGATNTVTLANGITGGIEASIAVGEDPDGAIFDPISDRAFVLNGDGMSLSVIDVTHGKEESRIALRGKPEGVALDGSGTLFITLEDKGQLIAIDTRSHEIKRHQLLIGCEAPGAVAYVPTGQMLVVTCANEHARVVGAVDGHAVADIAIGPHPDAALFDAARNRVYIATAGSLTHNGEIVVLNVSAPTGVTVLDRIATQRGARTLAEDFQTGRLYLPTATYAVGWNLKPFAVADTFKVLVVAP